MNTPISRLGSLCRVGSQFARNINMAESYTSTVTYIDRDLFIVPEFTYSFVEKLHQEQAYLGKCHTYSSEGYIFGIKDMYVLYVIVIPLLGSV